MNLGLKGKRALVLAAAGGLGSAVCRSLAAEGTDLVMADVNQQALDEVVTAVKTDFSVSVGSHVCDLGVPSSVDAMICGVVNDTNQNGDFWKITDRTPARFA